MTNSPYVQITAADLIRNIKSNPNRTFENYEITDELEIIDLELDFLSFKNCCFNEDILISGNLGSGLTFSQCLNKKKLTLSQISSVYKNKPLKNITKIGLNSSITLDNCTINTFEVYSSNIERGIQIINDSTIENILINRISNNANSPLKIHNSKITSQFDLYVFKCIGNIDIRKSEINCFARFENIKASSLNIQDTKFNRLYVWGSTFTSSLSIHRTDFSDQLEFQGTNFGDHFGLFDSTFTKEISIKNDDKANSIQSHINHYIIQSCNFESGLHAIDFKPDFHPDVTIHLSNSLKGNIFFESVNFNKVILVGHNNGLSLTFDTCKFISFQCKNVTNNQTIRLSNCDALKSGEDSELSITNSNLGKMNLLGCDLSSFDIVKIKSSFISDIQFANIKWFNDHSLKESNDQNKETYRQLKLAAEKQGDTVTALNFRSKELFFYQKMLFTSTSPTPWPQKLKYLMDILFWLPQKTILYLKRLWNYIANLLDPSKTLGDRIILFLGRTTNNFGTNWIKPIVMILLGTLFFHIVISISLSPKLSWSLDIFNIAETFSVFSDYPSLYFHLLNPTHDLNRIVSSQFFSNPVLQTVHWSVYALDMLHRIMYGFLLFQLIVAFRKFVK